MRARLPGFLLCALSLFPFGEAAAAPSLKVTSANVCDASSDACGSAKRRFENVAALKFVTVVEGATGEAWVEHVWKRDGRVVFRLRLPVRAGRYRTASRKSVAGLNGAWTVEVLDPVGRALATQAFEVAAPAPEPARGAGSDTGAP